jgi:nucleotide-binding universal stress UspA family protein
MMPFRRVVVGVDFTDTSLATVRWVSAHLAPEASLVLAHIVREPRTPPFLRAHLPPVSEIVTERETALYRGLCGLADLVGRDRTSVEMLSGAPADGLALIAHRLDADLVCVGKSVQRRGSARFGATTASRLLARSGVPLLVVPGGARATPTRVLAAVSDLPPDERVLHHAGALASAWGAQLDALHVVERDVRELAHDLSTAQRESRGVLALQPMDDERLRMLAEEWLGRQLPQAGMPPGEATPAVREGDAGQEIIAYARTTRADLIVVGRGALASLGGASHSAVGSTTRLTLWAAHCPVLVLGTEPTRAAPSQVAQDAGLQARRAPLVLARSAMHGTLALDRPRRPRRPGPGGDAA